MNDMNELTNKLQQVMVPKAALIAYEYRENRYGNGMHYLELHPINDRGRMEAAVPVTYEFMNALVESYTDDRRNVPHGKIPANMLWCDTRKGHERYIWYNPPGKRRMFFARSLNIPDGTFHVPGVIYMVSGDRLDIFSYKGEKPAENSPLFLAPFLQCHGQQCLSGKCHVDSPGRHDFLKTPRVLGKTFLAQRVLPSGRKQEPDRKQPGLGNGKGTRQSV